MMDKSFIQEIVRSAAEVTTKEGHGCTYTNREMHLLHPPVIRCMTIHTLSGIVDYLKDIGGDEIGIVDAGQFIQVVNYNKVTVRSLVVNEERVRESFVTAELVADPFEFGRDVTAEKFIISMQAKFVRDDMVDTILKVAGNITSKAELRTLDDGVTQTTTAKTGIAKVENVVVPNPVTLRPYRTFSEIEQPASDFVFRMNANGERMPTCALHEADGGAWKSEAIQNIKEYFNEELPHIVVLA